MSDRKEEVRKLMRLTPKEVIKLGGHRLIINPNLNALYQHFANDIASEIKKNNEHDRPTRLILPIGPVGQYPILASIINKERISLKNCWFFFMDEYCDENGKALAEGHVLSFKRIARENFLKYLDENNGLATAQVVFPDENNITSLAKNIDDLGGIDTCYGGIGIHGHIAFNEPEVGVSRTGPRRVRLNNYTITINAIRAEIGGDLENFPKEAFTLGMTQILDAKRIRLYCRNGTPCDWANTVLRIALLGQPGDDYPCTYIRNHPNYKIITDTETLTTPKNIL